MEAQDMVVGNRQDSRIDVVKAVVGDFVERREGDRLGLILFAAHAYIQAPLTFDRETVGTLLEEAEIGIIEESATAIGDAIGLAVIHLRTRPENSRVLVLLTDGVNNAGADSPEQAGQLAQQENIKIYTIGIGQAGVVMRTENHPFFGQIKRRVRSDLDEASLTRVAEITGGKYFNAATTGALRDVYKEIDQLERTELETTRFYRWDEKFAPIALAGLICLVLEIFLAQTIFRRIP